jgi:hypothetical protein
MSQRKSNSSAVKDPIENNTSSQNNDAVDEDPQEEEK